MQPIEVSVPPQWLGLSASEIRRHVAETLDSIVRERATIDDPEVGPVRIERAGQRKMISERRDPAKLLMAADLASVLPDAVLASRTPAKGGQNHRAFVKLVAPVEVGGTQLAAVFTLVERNDGTAYYNAVALEDQKQEAPTEAGASTPGPVRDSTTEAEGDPLLTGVARLSRHKLTHVKQDTVSKAIDPTTGEPLVVYHATKSDFSVFDTAKSSTPGMWFTENRAEIEGLWVAGLLCRCSCPSSLLVVWPPLPARGARAPPLRIRSSATRQSLNSFNKRGLMASMTRSLLATVVMALRFGLQSVLSKSNPPRATTANSRQTMRGSPTAAPTLLLPCPAKTRSVDGKQMDVYVESDHSGVRGSGRRLFLDASYGDPGKSMGSVIYAALFQFALNNNMVFIGDPSSLSDAALLRRTEHMLSAAIKQGTTRMMEPHLRQMEPANKSVTHG